MILRVLLKSELTNGAEYLGSSRFALSARWEASTERFKYLRFNYGYIFVEEIVHRDDAKLDEDSFRPFALVSDTLDELTKGR
jgi:hypothetical protein